MTSCFGKCFACGKSRHDSDDSSSSSEEYDSSSNFSYIPMPPNRRVERSKPRSSRRHKPIPRITRTYNDKNLYLNETDTTDDMIPQPGPLSVPITSQFSTPTPSRPPSRHIATPAPPLFVNRSIEAPPSRNLYRDPIPIAPVQRGEPLLRSHTSYKRKAKPHGQRTKHRKHGRHSRQGRHSHHGHHSHHEKKHHHSHHRRH